ncbi:hypothetical protein AB5J72_42480 [Streptomyces sp. CG1]|uniref:hypothetical protein n=1 Tax=Streptomyces sp. CG1 TaxID=1287523 RepID=UPI0034E2AF58
MARTDRTASATVLGERHGGRWQRPGESRAHTVVVRDAHHSRGRSSSVSPSSRSTAAAASTVSYDVPDITLITSVAQLAFSEGRFSGARALTAQAAA